MNMIKLDPIMYTKCYKAEREAERARVREECIKCIGELRRKDFAGYLLHVRGIDIDFNMGPCKIVEKLKIESQGWHLLSNPNTIDRDIINVLKQFDTRERTEKYEY